MMLVGSTLQSRMMGEYMFSITSTLSNSKVVLVAIEPKADGTFAFNTMGAISAATIDVLPLNFTANNTAWNSQGTTLAFNLGNINPYIRVYNKIGNTLTNALTLNGSVGDKAAFQAIDWHPNGQYLTIGRSGSNSTGQINFWERDGDTLTLNTGTFDYSVTATISVISLAWNPQGTTLAIGTSSSPHFLILYNFDPVTKNFTRIDGPIDRPITLVRGIAWNHDGSSLAVTDNLTLRVYNRESDTFTQATTVVESSAWQNIAWSGNGEHLVGGLQFSPFIRFLYRPPGTTATIHQAANPATTSTNYVVSCDINYDGTLVCAATIFNQNANQYYYRDPATTSTWINLNLDIAEAPSNSRGVRIYP